MIAVLVAALTALGLVNLGATIAALIVGRPFADTAGLEHDEQPLGSVEPAFVSVHVAVHDEPADLVIATIAALHRSDHPAFEVLVIDNNTPDPATWRPVADHVATLGEHIRFFHVDGVAGAKAGALNIALELTDARATHVAIVDADYQVAPHFLTTAVAACADAGFVQFPQAYRRAAGAEAVVAELSDYFETFPRAANRARASLLTGTLSLIAIDALRRVGGWPTGSITEDAELGVALWSAGARGRFIDRDVGRGLLPVDLAGLRLQRRRWVSGNVQTLLHARHAIRSARVGALAVIAQLTAWVGLLALPLVTLMLLAIARGWPTLTDGAPSWLWRSAEWIAVATILIALLGHIGRALVRRRVGSLAVTFALLWTSSFAWLPALGRRRLTFRRTPKAAGRRGGPPSLDTIGSLAALATAVVLGLEGSPVAALALAASAAGLATAPLVDRSLRRAAS